MARTTFTVKGLQVVLSDLQNVAAGCEQVARTRLVFTSRAPYSSPIDIGYYLTGRRAGRIARRAGGAHFVQAVTEFAEGQAAVRYARGIAKGPTGVQNEATQLARDITTLARRTAPRVSGELSAGMDTRTVGGV